MICGKNQAILNVIDPKRPFCQHNGRNDAISMGISLSFVSVSRWNNDWDPFHIWIVLVGRGFIMKRHWKSIEKFTGNVFCFLAGSAIGNLLGTSRTKSNLLWNFKLTNLLIFNSTHLLMWWQWKTSSSRAKVFFLGDPITTTHLCMCLHVSGVIKNIFILMKTLKKLTETVPTVVVSFHAM